MLVCWRGKIEDPTHMLENCFINFWRMVAGNHFLNPSGKQRIHYVNKRFSVPHWNPFATAGTKRISVCRFRLIPYESVALSTKKLTGIKNENRSRFATNIMLHNPGSFSSVYLCIINRYMPTFYNSKLLHDLYVLLDQEMLKLIFTNTLKTFSPRAAHAINNFYSVQMVA